MPFFSRVFKVRDGHVAIARSKKQASNGGTDAVLAPSRLCDDGYARTEVDPLEVQELVHVCTQEVKSRALDMPFLLLPFRPTSDPSAARTFIRNFFKAELEGSSQYHGEGLQLELRLVEPLVLCSILKWCWGRLPGGVVTWDAYKLFSIGEQTSNMARHAFESFIPLSVESDSRSKVIFDFFDLLAAIAAHSKTNGFGGRKLSRMAGWWAFEHFDQGKGFEGGYKSWESAANATSHLFFAYLRALSPDAVKGISGFSALPRSLQALVSQTEYPPEKPSSLRTSTTKVVMIVDSVSPTPFALLRRARNFDYRPNDWVLQEYSRYEDPVQGLTDECRRVLRCISSTNQLGEPVVDSETGARSPDATWSQFEDLGFSGFLNGPHDKDKPYNRRGRETLCLLPQSGSYDLSRPTTPSWADFMSVGFADEPGKGVPPPLLLPHDKVLPPIGPAWVQSSQSHLRAVDAGNELEPGELASITQVDLDDTFWWVWMTSLAEEEPAQRKAVFGRCALIETHIAGGRWLIMEEQVKGAATAPEEGAYIAEKKSRFGFTRRKRLVSATQASSGDKATDSHQTPYSSQYASVTRMSNVSTGSEQHARVQAAAAAIAQKQKAQELEDRSQQRKRRLAEDCSSKTSSALNPVILAEAASAMKWASRFDKNGRQSVHLHDALEERKPREILSPNEDASDHSGRMGPPGPAQIKKDLVDRELPALPNEESGAMKTQTSSRSPEPADQPPANLPITVESTVEVLRTPVTALPPAKAIDRKPVPRVRVAEQHPVFCGASSEPAFAAIPNGRLSVDATSRDSESSVPNPGKLSKSPSGGFKRLFRKKRRESLDGSAIPEPSQIDNGLRPTRPSTEAERLFDRRKKGPPAPIAIPISTAAEGYSDPAYVATASEEPVPTLSEAAVSRSREVEPALVSPVDTIERRDAEYAFDRFAQGPLEHMPLFVPVDAAERAPSPEPRFHADEVGFQSHAAKFQLHEANFQLHEAVFQPHEVNFQTPRFQTLAAARLFPMPEVEEPASPILSKHAYLENGNTYDNISERSIDLQQQLSPVQDRWAQIRKNAAELAARRSEEQSMISNSVRTDEGETNGEETIEARVARIKARVAELTGAPTKPVPLTHGP